MNKKIDDLVSRIQEDEADLFEMANFNSQKTGAPYIIHIRTRLHTPSHPGVATVKVFSGRPFAADNFSLIISDDPEVPENQHQDQFFKSVSARELKKLKLWVSTNKDKLLDFYFNGMGWDQEENLAWQNSLVKV